VSELASSLRHSSVANAADERQQGGLVSELASSPFDTTAPRTRPTSDSEGGWVSELAGSPFNTAAPRTRPTSEGAS